MIGLINYKKLEKDFLLKVYQKSEQEYQECLKNLDDHRKDILQSLYASWLICLRKLGDQYRKLQDSGVTGELCYGYLSYLRSGVLKKSDWFRMDYYDSRNCASIIECGGSLEGADILFARFNQCTDEIISMLASQSRVKPYMADRIIYQLADRYYKEIEPLILESFHRVIEEEGKALYNTLTVTFYTGELFAGSKCISIWNGIQLLNV